uniref:Uncharacterized protein n=1 Tax=Tetranychus urticae TaxID=32264 RepID=T1KFI9_TETUR
MAYIIADADYIYEIILNLKPRKPRDILRNHDKSLVCNEQSPDFNLQSNVHVRLFLNPFNIASNVVSSRASNAAKDVGSVANQAAGAVKRAGRMANSLLSVLGLVSIGSLVSDGANKLDDVASEIGSAVDKFDALGDLNVANGKGIGSKIKELGSPVENRFKVAGSWSCCVSGKLAQAGMGRAAGAKGDAYADGYDVLTYSLPCGITAYTSARGLINRCLTNGENLIFFRISGSAKKCPAMSNIGNKPCGRRPNDFWLYLWCVLAWQLSDGPDDDNRVRPSMKGIVLVGDFDADVSRLNEDTENQHNSKHDRALAKFIDDFISKIMTGPRPTFLAIQIKPDMIIFLQHLTLIAYKEPTLEGMPSGMPEIKFDNFILYAQARFNLNGLVPIFQLIFAVQNVFVT